MGKMRRKGLASMAVQNAASAATVDLGPASGLSCRECGEVFPLGPIFACELCFGPLEVAYELPTGDPEALRKQIEAGPANIWRYAPLLPVPADVAEKPNLNPGWTKLVQADNLAREIGVAPGKLFVKDDSGNPTHSCVFIPHDLEQGKVVMAGVYGGELVAIEGNYDDVNRFCSELIGDPLGEGWGFVNVNLRPYYGEGSKTLAYEICEQLGWVIPDQLVIPIASGSQLTKIDKGLQELIKLGLVEDKPYKIFGAQAEGCSPVSVAFKAGHDVVRPQKPNTIAKSLAIGNPADGPYVLDIARRTGGAVEDVDDEQVVDAIKLLARTEGIFAETAGGVTLGVTRKLVKDGLIDPNLTTVVLNTGDGLKTLDAVADTSQATATIRPSLDAFRDAGLAV